MKKDRLIQYLDCNYPLFNVDSVQYSRGDKNVVIKTSAWEFYTTKDNRLFIVGDLEDYPVEDDLIVEYLEERLNSHLSVLEHNLKVLEECKRTLRI